MFITFEGIEGVGKTTHLQWMASQLIQKGRLVMITREPGGTPMGEDIRKVVLAHRHEYVVPMTELMLMFAARVQHVEAVIRPALMQDRWVLCDRFIDATYAYQGGGRGIPAEIIRQLEVLTIEDCQPNYTLLFDAPVETGLERVKFRNNVQDRIEKEKIDFFERVRQTYLQRAAKNKDRYRVIDATQSLDVVQQAVMTFMDELVESYSG